MQERLPSAEGDAHPTAIVTLISMLGLVILFAAAMVLLVVTATAMLAWEMRHPPRHTAGWALARGRPCDPGDLGLAFEEWMLEIPDARLPVWEIEGSAPDGPIVVFVHGWGESRLDVLQRIEPWMQYASKVVAFDLRGHGDAEGAASRLGSGEHDELLRLLDRLGEGPMVLVGWSIGGVIALAAASNASEEIADRIQGIATIGAYADFHTSLRGRLAVQDLPGRPLTDLALLVHRCMGIPPPGGRDFAARLQCPVVYIHGRGDAVVPVGHAAELAAASASARSVIIDTDEHCDVRPANVDQFDEAVEQLLGKIVSRGGGEAAATHNPTAV